VSVGLIALLDDVAGLARLAAASLDDLAGQAAKAGAKAAGVVIDDAAVTPRYVTGLAPARELPIVWRIALGSLRNKLLILLPAALALSAFAPWLITPLLMIGGAYLAYEGTEKVYVALAPHAAHHHEEKIAAGPLDPVSLENQKVAGAIRTDLILSAEIMAIALAAIPTANYWQQAVILVMVGLGITVVVYGAVALIVKADDAGIALAANRSPSPGGKLARLVGRGLVYFVPVLLSALSVVGTAAMIWVGGGIILHAFEAYGWLPSVTGPIHHAAEAAAHALPAVGELASWSVTALVSGVIGLALGAALIPVTEHVIAPAWRMARRTIAPARAS
jgi:predicted DNA repair protein MutK